MNILKLLNSPVPVAWFQYLCGLKWKNPDPSNPIYPVEQPTTSKNAVETSTKSQQKIYISNKISFFLAKAGTELAGEPFYYVFYPACAWLFEIRIARRTLIMLTASMYIGQMLKDILKLPRPASPPVIRLETRFDTEYGMPSTHTVAAVTSPFSLLVFASQVYEIPIGQGALLASMWSSTVALSRLYLGMHTFLETASGAVLSFALLSCHPVVSWFEEIDLNSSTLFSIGVGIGSLLLARILFMLDNEIDASTSLPKWNTARGDTTELIGWCAGFLIGSKFCICQEIFSETTTVSIPHVADAGYSILRCTGRFSAGALLVAPCILMLRKVLLKSFIQMHGFSHLDISEAKQKCSVELPYKFFSTFLTAIFSTTVIPIALQRFRLW